MIGKSTSQDVIGTSKVSSGFSGATIILVFIAILSRLVTVVTHIVIASQFGTSMAADAYFATENIPEIFISIVAIGFSMVFIPAFTEYQLGDKQRARRFSNSFFLLTAVLSLTLTILCAYAAPFIVKVLAPGFNAQANQIAIPLVRVMAISIFFLGLDGGIRGLLHAHNRFVLSDIARILYNGSLLMAALFFAERFGIIALAWGIVVGAALQFFLQLAGAFLTGSIEISWDLDWADTRQAAIRILPFIIGVINVQVFMLIDRMTASGLRPGDVAALNFALRLVLLPVGIFALPLRTTIYPDISRFSAQDRLDEAGRTVLNGLRILMYSILPASVGIILLRLPLTKLLFERGAFDHLATQATSEALVSYAFGVPAIAMIFVLNNVFLAIGKTRILIIFSTVAWISNYFLNIALSQQFGHIGIGLATSLICTALVACMIITLSWSFLPTLSLQTLARSFIKISLAAAIMAGLTFTVSSIMMHSILDLHSLLHQLILVATVSGVGGLVYLVSSYLLNLEEYRQLMGMMRRKQG